MILYKYTRHNNCCKYNIIRHCELWFADIKTLNDPMDLNLTYRQHYSDDEIREYWENLSHNKQDLQENLKRFGSSKSFVKLRKEQLNQGKAKIGVLCMSKNPKNILMWSHYADAHRGIVYGFDENLFKDSNVKFISKKSLPIPMDYYREYEPLSYAKVGSDNIEQLKKLLTLKAKDWNYEKEVRFIVVDKGSVAINFNPQCLKYIIFGANTQEQEIDKVKSLCKENGKLNHIRFKQAEFMEGKFALKLNQI